MRFFLDENETAAILDPIRVVFFEHEFRGAHEEELGGTDDIPLFEQLAQRGYDAIITRDINQLADPSERQALIDNRLHWIGHREAGGGGLAQLAATAAAYLAAMPHILALIPTVAVPYAFRVKGIQNELTQRVRHTPL